jgi:hypoxanthine phosphoribosyltransferase
MRLSAAPLLSPDRIQARVDALGAQIRHDYGGRDLVVLAVLKGALFFTADLVRAMAREVVVDCVRAQSYAGTASTGEVRFTLLPEVPLAGRHVLVVEDILDTGRTATALLERLAQEQPASLALCTLLDKPDRRVVPVRADYVGFTIPDHFVIGYGLDHDERHRELPGIWTLEPA